MKPENEGVRTVGFALAPTGTRAVYFDTDTGEMFLKPIIFVSIEEEHWTNPDGGTGGGSRLRSWSSSPWDGWSDCEDDTNFVGILDPGDPDSMGEEAAASGFAHHQKLKEIRKKKEDEKKAATV